MMHWTKNIETSPVRLVYLLSNLIFSNCEVYLPTIFLTKLQELILIVPHMIKLEHLDLPTGLILYQLFSLHKQI